VSLRARMLIAKPAVSHVDAHLQSLQSWNGRIIMESQELVCFITTQNWRGTGTLSCSLRKTNLVALWGWLIDPPYIFGRRPDVRGMEKMRSSLSMQFHLHFTEFMPFQKHSVLRHRLSSINSWLITWWSYQQFVDKTKSLSTIHISTIHSW
jgi:hypothetical protein